MNSKLQAGSFINGKEMFGNGRAVHDVRSPYDGAIIGTMEYASLEDVVNAIAAAERVFHSTMKILPAYRRAEILSKASDLLEERVEDYALMLAREAGKPIRDGRAEVGRAVQLLRFASDEAKTMHGELVPMDAAIGGENRLGMVRRYPIGVVAAITPFNFPLNLVLHKLAPAIAASNTVVLKEKTPFSAIMLAKLFHEAGLPAGALNVIQGRGEELVPTLVTNSFIRKVTFTGSASVGLSIKQMAGLKRVTLELGSNTPNLIFEDGNLNKAAQSLVKGAFAFSGQVCISAQRIYIHRSVYQSFLDSYIPQVNQLVLGDPLHEETDLGPMITEEAAIRAEQWIKEAQSQGAIVITGGKRSGTMLEPTVLIDVTPEMKVVCKEIFAPVVSIIPFDTEEEVVRLANASDYGLQAGVFTDNINRALRIADQLETGGVWINEISTYRQDNQPYGGVKLSGTGKEGVRYAVEEMTEMKFIGIHYS
ncbi:aldehyde dehydrogenase family protein [Paenibacillus sp. UNC451MF]|uniref:aldehyde dehydrogenase family protein n=1 Tax=Paenibacillus sp. UNC451MF TaxID=1449063 RepID=UPI00048C8C67|nr:aldehyde dehydrogenase family protein [Paenibacillus sp. UNC451MF]